MTPHWHRFLESTEAVFSTDSDLPLHFGDASGELQAAAAQTVLVPLTHLAVIDVSGEDARSFLHSQTTSDINHLALNQVQHAGWCTAKGRMQASFLVWRQADGYRLIIAADLLEASLKRLKMFVLRSKVTLTANTDAVVLGISGSQAAEALQAAGLTVPDALLTQEASGDEAVLAIDDQRYLLVTPFSRVASLWPNLSNKARPAGVPVWRWLDVRAAFPLVTLATKEEFVPQMADFEKIGGVSFHKGCYPGQEIVARTQYLGKVKRHLFRLSAAHALNAGDHLYSPDNPDQTVGMVMSAAPSPTGGYSALAVVQSNFAGNLRLGSREGAVVEASAVNPD